MREQVQEISLTELHSFKGHPFQVKDDESMLALCDSIKEYGVLSPLLARPTYNGYEIVSGHRRKAAALRLGLDKLPVLVRDMTDDEAVILMVDSNIQRENLLPSEKAFAYKMKMEALKRKAGRPKKNQSQVATNFDTASLIGQDAGESRDQVFRYIRLTNLAKPILDMVDEQRIALSPAVELSYDKELTQLQSRLSAVRERDKLSYETATLQADIKRNISDILRTKNPDEVFYKNVLEQILVDPERHLTIKLNLLSPKWKYVLDSVCDIRRQLQEPHFCSRVDPFPPEV